MSHQIRKSNPFPKDCFSPNLSKTASLINGRVVTRKEEQQQPGNMLHIPWIPTTEGKPLPLKTALYLSLRYNNCSLEGVPYGILCASLNHPQNSPSPLIAAEFEEEKEKTAELRNLLRSLDSSKSVIDVLDLLHEGAHPDKVMCLRRNNQIHWSSSGIALSKGRLDFFRLLQLVSQCSTVRFDPDVTVNGVNMLSYWAGRGDLRAVRAIKQSRDFRETMERPAVEQAVHNEDEKVLAELINGAKWKLSFHLSGALKNQSSVLLQAVLFCAFHSRTPKNASNFIELGIRSCLKSQDEQKLQWLLTLATQEGFILDTKQFLWIEREMVERGNAPLLDHIKRCFAFSYVHQRNQSGQTLLHLAVIRNDEDSVRFLLEHTDIDLSAKAARPGGRMGRTAKHMARKLDYQNLELLFTK